MADRMNGKRLNIGAYYLRPYACSERHIKDVKECGIDFIVDVPYDKAMLDLFAKYGIGAIIEGFIPRWLNGDGTNAGKMREIYPLTVYERNAAAYVDHPAIWAMDIGDEPSAKEFCYLNEVAQKTEQLFPRLFAYLNLYPSYAQVAANSSDTTKSQLGTSSYKEHIEQYCEKIKLDYISYDFYMYASNVAKAYENLEIVADACLKTGREMWIILQVNSNKPEIWISENQLRMQAYSAMAFGARNIVWACYTAGWWHNHVLDREGNKTEQYDKLKKVNGEIRNLSAVYDKYRRKSTYFVGFEVGDDEISKVTYMPVNHKDIGRFCDVCTDDGKFVIGHMATASGKGEALFVCAADDWKDANSKTTTLKFKPTDSGLKAYDANGAIELTMQNDYFALELQSCGAVIITCGD